MQSKSSNYATPIGTQERPERQEAEELHVDIFIRFSVQERARRLDPLAYGCRCVNQKITLIGIKEPTTHLLG